MKVHVLIVEDNPVHRDYLRSLVGSIRVPCGNVRLTLRPVPVDGQVAGQKELAEDNTKFACVLLDIDIGGDRTGGLAFIDELQEQSLPIVIVTIMRKEGLEDRLQVCRFAPFFVIDKPNTELLVGEPTQATGDALRFNDLVAQATEGACYVKSLLDADPGEEVSEVEERSTRGAATKFIDGFLHLLLEARETSKKAKILAVVITAILITIFAFLQKAMDSMQTPPTP